MAYNKLAFITVAVISANLMLSDFAVAEILGQKSSFFVNEKYDASGRSSLTATLRAVSDKSYIYVDDSYFDRLSQSARQSMLIALQEFGNDFDNTIYSGLTGIFGFEPNPGVDGDSKLYVLIQETKDTNGGYIDSENFSSSEQSNQKEIVFISAQAFVTDLETTKAFLAHEFQHIISYNQKELTHGAYEEIWLNELRSEHAPTMVGLNSPFAGTILQDRKNTFLSDPSNSLVEWPNEVEDYGIASMLGEYLVEQHGIAILSDTIKSRANGIQSLNNFLISRGKEFKEVFLDWMTAVYVNDLRRDSRFGYSRLDLADIRVRPQHILTLNAESPIFINEQIKPWQPLWLEFDMINFQDKALKVDLSQYLAVRALAWYGNGSFSPFDLPDGGGYVTNNGSGIVKLTLLVTNNSKISGFGASETPQTASFILSAAANEKAQAQQLKDGALIRKFGQTEIYVISGKYKRYLLPEVIKMYGHLDPQNAIEVLPETFDGYITSNYIKNVSREPVYTVWSDGTKHWLNMTGKYFTESGRDWGSIFVINDLEVDFYRTGPDVTR